MLEWEVALDPNEEVGGVVKQCALARGEDGEVVVAVVSTKKGEEGGDEVVLVKKEGAVKRVEVMEGEVRKIVAAHEALGEERDESGFVLETAAGEILEGAFSPLFSFPFFPFD